MKIEDKNTYEADSVTTAQTRKKHCK